MNHIKIARAFRNMTAERLGTTAGIMRHRITEFETGARPVSREMGMKIAAALDVDIAWVMGCPQMLQLVDPLARDHKYTALIMRAEEVDGYGMLYHVYLDEEHVTGIVAVILGDGLQITTADWQSAQPQNAEEIRLYRWMDPWGRDCVMLDGLPRAV